MKLLANHEVLRRLAAVAGLFGAILMYFGPVSQVLKVQLYQFDKRQAREPVASELRQLPLDQYIVHYTKDRLKQVSGPEWQALVKKMQASAKGRTPGEWRRLGSGREYFFPPDWRPLAGQAPRSGKSVFLAVEVEGTRHYLYLKQVSRSKTYRAKHPAYFPYRSWAWLALALGLAVYFFTPRVRKPTESLGYTRLWGHTMTDFLGLALAGGCFLLPIFVVVIEEKQSLAGLFDSQEGYLWLTLSLWLASAGCLLLMYIGVWYRNLWISFTPQGLERHTPLGSRMFYYRDMEKASVRTRNYKWLVGLTMILGDAKSMARAASLSSAKGQYLVIEFTKAKPLWINLQSFQNPQKLILTLKESGV